MKKLLIGAATCLMVLMFSTSVNAQIQEVKRTRIYKDVEQTDFKMKKAEVKDSAKKKTVTNNAIITRKKNTNGRTNVVNKAKVQRALSKKNLAKPSVVNPTIKRTDNKKKVTKKTVAKKAKVESK